MTDHENIVGIYYKITNKRGGEISRTTIDHVGVPLSKYPIPYNTYVCTTYKFQAHSHSRQNENGLQARYVHRVSRYRVPPVFPEITLNRYKRISTS